MRVLILNICFYGKILGNILKLSLLPLLVWSTDSRDFDVAFLQFQRQTYVHVFQPKHACFDNGLLITYGNADIDSIFVR